MPFIRRLKGFVRRRASLLADFARARDGNVAMIFALSLIPICIAAGAGLDMARAMVVKSNMTEALDAAGLAVGATAGLSQDQMNSVAQNYFNANFRSDSSYGTPAPVTVTQSGQDVVLSTSVNMPTTLMEIAGIHTVPIGVSITVTREFKNLEIALVLDNTGSMAGSKISALKTAASNFVDTMAAVAGSSPLPNPVKISVVPYTMTVNVGTAYKSASWMSGVMPTAYGSDIFTNSNTNRFTLLSQMGVSWQGCVEIRPHPYDVQDTAPSSGATLYVPFFSPDEPDDSNQGYVNSYLSDYSGDKNLTWKVKQGDPLKYTKSPKSGTNGIGYQFGPNAGCSLQPLIRLTTDFSSVKQTINGMVAGGDTIIHAGFAWGWNTLSPNAPFADGAPYNDGKTMKIMILMTDGENHNVDTSSPDDSVYGGAGYIWQGRLGITSGSLDQRRVALDNLLIQACTNAKAEGVIIYSIMFDVANDAQDAPAMMQQCATSAQSYYLVQNVGDLTGTFQQIANSIQNLHISK